MNLNQIVISRSGYTLLDFLSDVGGINGMLMSCATVVLAFWNYDMLNDSMVTKLFKLKPKKPSHSDSIKNKRLLK